MKNYSVYTDGGARGNPGPAAVGVVIKDPSGKENLYSRFIGISTNNYAEYEAVIDALKILTKHSINKDTNIYFHLDSQLVVRQLNGDYRIKDEKLRNQYARVKYLEQQLTGNVQYEEIPRYLNRNADMLVNQALDQQ